MVDCLGRVADIHVNAGKGDVKLLGDDLSKGRDDTGSEIDLAGEDGHGAVLRDCQPGIQVSRVGFAGRVQRPGRELA